MSDNNVFKIVVVDDSEYSRKSIVQTLEQNKFYVAGEAKSIDECYKIFETTNIDLAIIDVVMPEKTGIELARDLCKSRKKLAIIFISSLKPEYVIIEAISAGAIDFLQKPFSEEELLHSVQKTLIRFEDES